MQTATGLKTEFIRHKVFDSWYHSLYVNGQKTNIYYPEMPSTFFLVSKEKAEAEAELIKKLDIFPHDGNYENFDTCGTAYFDLSKAEKVNFDPNYWNNIYRCSGGNYETEQQQEQAMNEIKKQIAHWSQWTKAIDRNTGKILKNIGVKFYPCGYTVFFY